MIPVTLKAAIAQSGRVSGRNSKMPGTSYATDPYACKAGDKLARIPGSVCHACYARKLAHFRPVVGGGWAKNQAIADHADRDTWIAGMVYQLNHMNHGYHRWFDAGDLSSIEQLDRIAEVCKRTPKIKHWLPTREIGIVRKWMIARIMDGKRVPANLVIRLSSTMIDDKPRLETAKALGRGIACSVVHSKGSKAFGYACPSHTAKHRATRADNAPNCADCRACWDRRVKTVSYQKH